MTKDDASNLAVLFLCVVGVLMLLVASIFATWPAWFILMPTVIGYIAITRLGRS